MIVDAAEKIQLAGFYSATRCHVVAMDMRPETVFKGIQGYGTEITFSGEHAVFIGRSSPRLALRVFLVPIPKILRRAAEAGRPRYNGFKCLADLLPQYCHELTLFGPSWAGKTLPKKLCTK
jgi:PII-like signaling protein